MRTAIQKSCDVYFYEVARLLGVDRHCLNSEKIWVGTKILENFIEERPGLYQVLNGKENILERVGILAKHSTQVLAKDIFIQLLYNYV